MNIFSKLPQILINYHVAAALRRQIHKSRAAHVESSRRSSVTPIGVASPIASPAAATRRLSSASTSQLSAVPFALNFFGSLSRLYTTMTQLQGDRLMLLGFAISCVLNGTIVAQCADIARLQRQWNEERERNAKTT